MTMELIVQKAILSVDHPYLHTDALPPSPQEI